MKKDQNYKKLTILSNKNNDIPLNVLGKIVLAKIKEYQYKNKAFENNE